MPLLLPALTTATLATAALRRPEPETAIARLVRGATVPVSRVRGGHDAAMGGRQAVTGAWLRTGPSAIGRRRGGALVVATQAWVSDRGDGPNGDAVRAGQRDYRFPRTLGLRVVALVLLCGGPLLLANALARRGVLPTTMRQVAGAVDQLAAALFAPVAAAFSAIYARRCAAEQRSCRCVASPAAGCAAEAARPQPEPDSHRLAGQSRSGTRRAFAHIGGALVAHAGRSPGTRPTAGSRSRPP